MKKIIITNDTTQETYDEILRMQDNYQKFELHTSCINSDTITKLIGFGEIIYVDMSPRNPKNEYDTIRELNMHDSDLVVVSCVFAKHTKNYIYSILSDIIDDPNMNKSMILIEDIDEHLTACCWNNLIVYCLDHNLRINIPSNRKDNYNKSIC